MPHHLKLLDLTHPLSSKNPTYEGTCGFNLSISLDYKDCKAPNLFRVNRTEGKAGVGTHMDAPAHCFPKGKTIDELDLEDLVTDCAVIDVSKESGQNYLAMPDAVLQFEREHGHISPNTFVIFYTGWDKFWNTPKKYRAELKAPGVHVDTAKLLLKRNIAGIGIDTLSADAGAVDFQVHRIVLGAGKYLVENIANAKKLPATGAKSLVLPIKIEDGTEAPIRLIALI